LNNSVISLSSENSLCLTGTITETSSLRYKKDIVNLAGALEIVMQLQGVSYKLKDSEITEIGFIAEQVAAVLPEVTIYKNSEIDSLAYSRITALLVEAIKEQQKQINELKQLLNQK
jgi:division protein CdvB (Snf7/Vps24/ESCRT-III family)